MFAKIFNKNAVQNSILFLITLLPVFYLPLKVSTLTFSKMFLFYVMVGITSVIVAVNIFRSSENKISLNKFSIASILVLLSYFVATIFSVNFEISFWGRDLALDSFVSILSLFTLMFLVSKFIDSNKTFILLGSVAVVSGFVSLIQILNLDILGIIFPLPTLGIFYDNAQNLVGKVNDLALFATLGIILITIALERLKFNQRFNVILSVIGVLNLILIMIVNFRFSFYVLAGFSIVFAVYNFLTTKKVSLLTVGIGVFAVLYILFGTFVSQKINSAINFSYLEVRPSVTTTAVVTQKSLKEKPLFGTGPATYEVLWPMYKPIEILQTDFWNLDLRYGNGLVSSFVATTGLVGGFFWLVFFIVLISYFVKSLFVKTKDSKKLFILNATGFLMVASWVISIFYISNIVLFAMTFVFTGLFISACKDLKVIKEAEIPVKNFIAKIFAILFIVAIFICGFRLTEKFIAHIYFQRANSLLASTSDLEASEKLLNKALHLDKIDTYHRSIASLNTRKMSNLMTADSNGSSQTAVQDTIKTIVDNYNAAIEYDPNNYNNFVNLADFYTDLARFPITGAADSALDLYNTSERLKPNNPVILLKRARLAFLMNDSLEARDLTIKSLALRPDNLDALLLLTQIDINTGKQEDAIQNMKNFIQAYPNNHSAMFQLGLTYLQLGQKINAINQFEQLYDIYPDNTDLQKIINDLKQSSE